MGGPFPWSYKMPCYHPIYMHYSTKGKKANGKHSIVSAKSPFSGKQLPLPCGRCIGCRLERSRQWAVRCMKEAQMHDHNEFITLTYHDSHLIYGGATHAILYPRHLTLFLKRLRKHYGPNLKFFACGEYGDKLSRPHYHAIMFGLNITDKKFHSSKNSINYYYSPTLNGIWTHGNVIIGDVTFESCAYVARYIMKKRLGKTAPEYDEEGITPEFVRMSRGGRAGPGGIGLSWLQKYQSDVYPRGTILANGHLCKPPKYFDTKFEEIDPIKMEAIRTTRLEAALENWQESTTKRLIIRERVKLNATKTLIRNLD